MSFINKINGRLFQLVINKAMGTGLIQEETTASGEKYITPGMPEMARKAAAEGCVLLKNKGVLPLHPENPVSIFGRCQFDWFYVGYGSGGDVHAPYYVSLADAVEHSGAAYNKELFALYKNWRMEKKNQADHGWWGHWPTSHPEMPLSKETILEAAANTETALVVIGRAAGEDRESTLSEGSFYLTREEESLLQMVTEAFAQTVVILDTGNVIDMSWAEKYKDKISAILIAWFGGMESGSAVFDILYGNESPSGKLTDTIACKYEDYPSADCFGGLESNEYKEGIYVGYRHFEKYAKEAILFPFGFGLSYTSFRQEESCLEAKGEQINASCLITNIGDRPGKEVVMLWCYPSAEGLDKPVRVLAGFNKTPLLAPGESCILTIESQLLLVASYDETSHDFLLDKGDYCFALNDAACGKITFKQKKILQHMEEALTSAVHLKARILEHLPEEITAQTSDSSNRLPETLTLEDVASGRLSLATFIAALSDEELEALSRGQGMMNSILGPSGNAGAFGGIIPSLSKKGVDPLITTDGPSGLRLNSYTSLLPCGTALASSWNTALTEELYSCLAGEMKHYGSDILLAPGMNLHRNPLCGRNFEYYSEDPLLSGKIAAAAVRGIQSQGGAACPKHFACNNQETKRNTNNSIVSERALREIYLKNFEICIKESQPLTIMTSYNKINGVWSHYNYDLVTTILRGQWGFQGTVITDWWMQQATSPEFPALKDNAYRVRAQVDVLMPGDMGHLAKKYKSDGTLLASLGKPEGITRAELQRTAANVLTLVLKLKKLPQK